MFYNYLIQIYMKLTKRAIKAINNRKAILAIALATGFSELWVTKLIDANKNDSALTSATAMKVIREETKLSDDEILEAQAVHGK